MHFPVFSIPLQFFSRSSLFPSNILILSSISKNQTRFQFCVPIVYYAIIFSHTLTRQCNNVLIFLTLRPLFFPFSKVHCSIHRSTDPQIHTQRPPVHVLSSKQSAICTSIMTLSSMQSAIYISVVIHRIKQPKMSSVFNTLISFIFWEFLILGCLLLFHFFIFPQPDWKSFSLLPNHTIRNTVNIAS